jgi:uncharacterized protein YjiS (DUF1127 family)
MQGSTMGLGARAAGRPLPALLRALRRRWRERRMARELEALDDAMLKDIGVHRGEIPSIVRARRAGPEWP